MIFSWSVATVVDEKTDLTPRPLHSICHVVWRVKNVPSQFIGSDTVCIHHQTMDLPASLPADAEFHRGHLSLRALGSDGEKKPR